MNRTLSFKIKIWRNESDEEAAIPMGEYRQKIASSIKDALKAQGIELEEISLITEDE
ncbi:MAG: hypothetical protein AB7G87_09115 [Clostridia bacterium]